MSQKTVQWLIGHLLSDEECRVRFLRNPLGTLVALRDQGYELTEAEIGALLRTDRALWIDGARRLDSHLQRCQILPAANEKGGST
jgi:hypothetical protein